MIDALVDVNIETHRFQSDTPSHIVFTLRWLLEFSQSTGCWLPFSVEDIADFRFHSLTAVGGEIKYSQKLEANLTTCLKELAEAELLLFSDPHYCVTPKLTNLFQIVWGSNEQG